VTRQHRFKQRKQLRDRRNDNSLVFSKGENGEWTPHDLRRTGATMMQVLGVMPEVIDRCQNQVLAGSRVRRHYLKYNYAVTGPPDGALARAPAPAVFQTMISDDAKLWGDVVRGAKIQGD
jgi:hypothetical protein